MSSGADGTPQYIRGVPHALPEGEQILWQGAPQMMAVAKHVFHWRLLAAYFLAMLVLWATTTEHAFASPLFQAGLVVRVALSMLVLGIVFGLSRVVAQTSWYAVTSQRLVLRLGMVFPMSINVPFTILESAGVGLFKDGTGQVALSLVKGNRLAYIALWPHCRVFSINHPQPVLRGLTEPQRIGTLLAQAVADASEGRASPPLASSTAHDASHLARQHV
jgi:hypothetical protein